MGSRVREDGSGDSRRDGSLCAESSVCADNPAGAESLSARKNLLARKRFPARARLPRYGNNFGGGGDLDDYCNY